MSLLAGTLSCIGMFVAMKLIYGCLIFASGLAEWSNPTSTVLPELHAPVRWGALLVILGGVYVALFHPRRAA
jgi:hypothetical protein